MRPPSRPLLALILGLGFGKLGCGSPVLAQQPAPGSPAERADAPTTIRTTVRRVILDVVVTDATGKPAPGLTMSDFALSEDGKKQTALSFDLHGFDGKMDYIPTKLPEGPLNSFINLPATPESGPLYVLLYDLVNTELPDQIFARQQLVKFIAQKPAGARFAIFVFSDGLHLVQGFTSDQKLLLASVDPQHSHPHVPMVFLMGNNNGQGDTKTMQEVFAYLGRYLDGLPGRKNVLWFSGGFPLALFASNEEVASYQEKTRQMLDLLARDQISIYPVSARGVIDHLENASSGATSASGGGIYGDSRDARPAANTGSSTATVTNTPGSASSASSAATGAGYSLTMASQQVQDEVANITGGRAFYSKNDAGAALAQATDDGSSYYTLTYAPTNHDYNGRPRSIHVALEEAAAKKGYHLAYRHAYYGTDPDASDQAGVSKAVEALAAPEKRQPGDSLSANMQHGAPTAHQIVFGAHLRAVGSPAMATPQQMARLAQQTGFSAGRHSWGSPRPAASVRLQTLVVDYAVIARQFAIAGLSAPPSIEMAAAAYDADGRVLSSLVSTTVESDATGSGEANGKDAGQKKVYRMEQRIDVPVTAVSLRLAVRDERTDRIGALEVALPIVPETLASQPSGAPPDQP